MRFLCLFLLLVAPAWSGATALVLDPARPSHDLAAAIEYLKDPGRALTLAEVQAPAAQGRFRAVEGRGRINFGYTASAYWLRVRLASLQAAPWLLELAYPPLDRVDLYSPDAAGGWRLQRSGDLIPFAARPYPDRNLVFPLDLPAGESTLYLRVASEGSMTIPATLWQPEAFARHAPTLYAVLALYFGCILALGGYNLLLWFSIRDRAYLEYVLFGVGVAIGLGSANGLAQQFLWPDWPAWGNVAFPIGFSIGGFFGSQFTRTFLDTRCNAPLADRALAGLMGLFVLSLAAHLVSYQAGAMLVSLGGLLVSVTSLFAGLAAWRRGHPGARFFLLAWSVLLIGVGVLGMRNFGWLPTNNFTTYAMQVGSALDMLLLSFALADRINTMRGEKEAAQAELLEARQHMVEALKQSELALEARVEERTRALAEANAGLKEKEQILSRLARQDVLTGLGNRIALEEEMHKAISRSGRLGTGVAAMLIDLDRFKPVNDEHGHGVGDEVLRLLAERLRGSTRRTDTVARLGGDEFVVLVEGRNAVTDAGNVADKIIAYLAQPFSVQGLDIVLGASIGIAVLAEGEEPDELLLRADRAMYQAKRAGGNRYAMAGA